MRRLLQLLFVLLAGAGLGIRADEGRIPIFQPTTITSSGSYVLTRDITVASGNVFTIQASDVTLDLNGRTVQVTSPGGYLIAIDTGASTLRVKNGALIGGQFGIANIGGTVPILLDVEKVDFLSHGLGAIQLTNAGDVRISKCSFRNLGGTATAILLQPPGPPPGLTSARIAENVFSNMRGAISTHELQSVAVLNNNISDTFFGIDLHGTTASFLVRGNVLEQKASGGFLMGINVQNAAPPLPGALILDNVVSGFAVGMRIIASGGVRVARNVVHRGVAGGAFAGDGILLLFNQQALLEDNQIQGNAGCGIRFDSSSSNNAYRSNMLRGNSGGAVCNSGVGNTDAGGNIL